MTQQEIHDKRVELYRTIEDSTNELKELRRECKHPNTFISNYSWRIGCIDEAVMCSDCYEFIRYTKEPMTFKTLTNE